MKISYTYPFQREFVSYLMDDINQLVLSKIDLEKCNAWRLHLQVLFLSNITNNQEFFLIKGILYGAKKHLKASNLQWPNQPSPNKKKHGSYGLVLSPKSIVQTISHIFLDKKKTWTLDSNSLKISPVSSF